MKKGEECLYTVGRSGRNESPSAAALQAARYNDALTQLAGLRPAVDAFFTEVMVNDPDPALRANRLAVVSQVRELFSGVADLSRLPG